MNDRTMNDNFNISDVFGSLRYGRFDKTGILLNAFFIALGVFFLMVGGLLAPLLYVNQICTISDFIFILVFFITVGLFFVIFFSIGFIRMKKGQALLRLCMENGDLHRSRAEVIVTTASGYRRTPAIITLRFKVNGKKYEKRNLKNIWYAEKYYYIDILYSPMHDEVFLLKMN